MNDWTKFIQTLRWPDTAITAGMLSAALLVIALVQFLAGRRWRTRRTNRKSETAQWIYTMVQKRLFPILYFSAILFALKTLDWPAFASKVLDGIALIVFLSAGVGVALSFVSQVISRPFLKRDETYYRRIFRLLNVGVRVVTWIVAALILFDNLGIKITGLLAGLGIGGVAVALASQAILGDLFSYFTIFMDRPFEAGDFIIVGDFMGTVDKIGIKSTRIRSLSGEEIVMSNTDLTGSRIRNYRRMEQRRVVFRIGVVYETPTRVLKDIPRILRGIIESTPGTVFDRSHFESYGDFSLNFETVYYVLGNDYNRYMDIHQAVNFRIKEAFERKKIGFAYPTRVVIGRGVRSRR